jgi:hypothetical protein
MVREQRMFSALAVVAWSGTLLRVVHDLYVTPGTQGYQHGLFGPYQHGVVGGLQQVSDDLSYFTHWSNLALAIVMTMLARNPQRDTPLFRAARNTALLMITMTGILYAALIAPTDHVVGWFNILTNTIIHYVNPPLAVVAWLTLGPRGWMRWRTMGQMYVVPSIYLLFTLLRGAWTHTYPYAFFNIVKLGYRSVVVEMLVIVAASTLVIAFFIIIDQWLTRRQVGRP